MFEKVIREAIIASHAVFLGKIQHDPKPHFLMYFRDVRGGIMTLYVQEANGEDTLDRYADLSREFIVEFWVGREVLGNTREISIRN